MSVHRPFPLWRAALCASALLLGCRETTRVPAPQAATPAPAGTVAAEVVVSSLHPAEGDTIAVLVRLAPGGKAAGSFTLRLAYDAAQLSFAGEVPATDGGMRMVNGEIPGEVRVAGISTDGFTSGDLTTLRFVAGAMLRESTSSLKLAVDELHATSGDDMSRVTVRPAIVDAGVGR
jgi:hypothetical protein